MGFGLLGQIIQMNCQKIILTALDLSEFKDLIREVLLENISNPIYPFGGNKIPDENLISRKEAAKFLGISLPTLSEIVKRNEIPAYKIRSRILFKKSEVLSSLKSVQTQKFKRFTV